MNRNKQNDLYQQWLKSDDTEPPDELFELCDEDALEISLTPEEQAQSEKLGDSIHQLYRPHIG